jgi:hypothetical protein
MLRRVLVALLSLALVAGLTACGNKKSRITHGETEGTYVDLGSLKYQVQISRQLNPRAVEDSEFLVGVRDQLSPQDAWFAVFMRVQNQSHHFERPATQYEIVDTQAHVFTPVTIDTRTNVFAYNPIPIPGESSDLSVLPNPNSAAAANSINGELVLFKIPVTDLDNRPLVLRIHDPANAQTVATVNLDV